MRNDAFLVVLTMTGSAMCWWPEAREPNLGFPWFVPLACIALYTALSTALGRGRWRRFLVASGVGTFAGLCISYAVWWPKDPIAGPLAPYSVAVSTIMAVLVSLVAGLVARHVTFSNEKSRWVVWLALVSCSAFGPVALALTPPLVRHRVMRNDRVAAERFESLKNAVKRTAAEMDKPTRICDGSALKRNYSGPPFTEGDWSRITGNYVRQDGYVFMVYCHEKGGYTVVAYPAREIGDGTRRFCTDESGRLGCGMEWNRSRYACLPCSK